MSLIQQLIIDSQFQLPDLGLVATKLAMAKANHSRSIGAVEEYRHHLAKSYGVQIKYKTAAGRTASATTKLSWCYSSPYHMNMLSVTGLYEWV